MGLTKDRTSRVSERAGLVMIIASLVVIGFVVALLLRKQRTDRENRIRAESVQLAGVLATVPFERLIANENGQSALQSLDVGAAHPDLAYAAVVGPDEPRGYLRLGCYRPGLRLSSGQVQFIAMLALPVFLLTPLLLERISTLISNLLSITKIETDSMTVDRRHTRLRDRLEDTGDALAIAARDTGIGIAEEDQGKVFDQFFRSERDAVRENSGHGLGLPLVRDIANLHRGELTLSSELGEGSQFTLRLYRDAEAVKRAI